MIRIYIMFVFSLAILPAGIQAGASSSELQRLQGDIKQLHQEIGKADKGQKREEEQLREIEKKISQSLKSIRAQNQARSKLEQSLNKLKKEKSQHQEKLAEHKTSLNNLLVRQYTQGSHPDLRILLNQDDPLTFARLMTYSRYLNEAHTAIISEVKQAINALETTVEQINQQQAQAGELNRQLAEQNNQLEGERSQRKKVISQIAHELTDKNQQLAKLLENEARLKNTLRRLSQAAPSPTKRLIFAKLKGALPWPTEGKLRESFGNPKGTSSLKWQGILIGTPPEQDVKSIAAGKIIFSDWLQGFGMLIIVDHGDEYISLYGQNQTLYKEVGDLVEQEDVIASVGDEQNSGLYFELRHKGKPINPKDWLKKL
jgi:septal ring factor EnvC (AmiA/AmiB activator)